MAALGFSLGCHAALLGLLPMFGRATLSAEQPIVVSLLGATGGGSGGGLMSGIADGDRAGSGPVQVPPATRQELVAADRPEAPAPVVPPRTRARVSAPLRAAVTAPLRDAARQRAAPAEGPDVRVPRNDAGADQLAAPASGTAASDESGSAASRGESESGIAAGAATDGSGSSRRTGHGAGSGEGNGNGDGNGGDLRASCASCPIPEYPARARREGWQGTVDVDLRVSGDGAVEDASVGRSSGFAALDAAAVTVARRSRFRVTAGAAINGQLRYRFVLEASDRPL
jgi:protein TonB